jgi:hypothetical protein
MPFKKGVVSNPNGRPRRPEIEMLRHAAAEVEVEEKKSLYKHAVQQAYKDNSVLIAIIKKFVPDITKADIDVGVNIPKGITINFSDGKKIEA